MNVEQVLVDIGERLKALEKHSHPPKETVPYEVYQRDVVELKKRIYDLEKRLTELYATTVI